MLGAAAKLWCAAKKAAIAGSTHSFCRHLKEVATDFDDITKGILVDSICCS
jgi:hypothetical protein